MTCPTCKARLQKERVYLWDGCADCFLAAADSLSGREIAEERAMCPCRMDYESIERAGIQDEGFWAAMNGTSFGGKDD